MTEIQTPENQTDENANENGENVTENATTENGTENPTAENTENVDTYVMPTADEINFGHSLLTDMGKQLLEQLDSLKAIDAVIARQKSDFGEEKLIDFAENSDDTDLKRLLDIFNKQVKRLEEVKSNLINKVSEKLGAEILSEDDIKAKKEERKAAADAIKTIIDLTQNLVSQGMAKDKKSDVEEFISHIKVPGSRSSSGSTSTGSATPKPRLNGGSVTVSKENHLNFPLAAKHLSTLVNREVSTAELINAWVDSQNVGDWKDTPEISEFTFEGHPVHVVKLEKKAKAA